MSAGYILLLALLGPHSACSLDSTRPSDSYVGTWNLRTINGQTLPYSDGAGLVIISQEITIQKGGSFSSNASSTLNGQQIGRSLSGSCAFNAPIQLLCTVTDGSAFGFVFQGDSLYTAVPTAGISVYRR
jgi:hypothetical protein